mmetsp:Transcript_32415/g.67011  ORF Transcript_32415/g.67011 Transcript_32415/m.67011 type:complete len:269 (-) Transcript_32415:124-930(-)
MPCIESGGGRVQKLDWRIFRLPLRGGEERQLNPRGLPNPPQFHLFLALHSVMLVEFPGSGLGRPMMPNRHDACPRLERVEKLTPHLPESCLGRHTSSIDDNGPGRMCCYLLQGHLMVRRGEEGEVDNPRGSRSHRRRKVPRIFLGHTGEGIKGRVPMDRRRAPLAGGARVHLQRHHDVTVKWDDRVLSCGHSSQVREYPRGKFPAAEHRSFKRKLASGLVTRVDDPHSWEAMSEESVKQRDHQSVSMNRPLPIGEGDPSILTPGCPSR